MHLFYCPDISGNSAILSAEESAHCIRVLRLKRDDKVQLLDGKGNLFEAVIVTPDFKACGLQILQSIEYRPQRNFKLHIAIAPTKSMDRFEWFVEKAVEIGIDVITPVLCQRSERRSLKTERLEKLAVSTMKQAKVYIKPEIRELIEYPHFLKTVAEQNSNLFIAHCDTTEKSFLSYVLIPGKNTTILIGPEGDFTNSEIKAALDSGFIPVSLSPNRLRTETAGIVACLISNLQ